MRSSLLYMRSLSLAAAVAIVHLVERAATKEGARNAHDCREQMITFDRFERYMHSVLKSQRTAVTELRQLGSRRPPRWPAPTVDGRLVASAV
jgi:hypothetical protein